MYVSEKYDYATHTQYGSLDDIRGVSSQMQSFHLSFRLWTWTIQKITENNKKADAHCELEEDIPQKH
jgi:hypothetical protein